MTLSILQGASVKLRVLPIYTTRKEQFAPRSPRYRIINLLKTARLLAELYAMIINVN